MPVNNFSIGHDVTVTIFDVNSNSLVAFPAKTGFSAEPIFKNLVSNPINGPPIFAEVPDGWKGTFDFDRTDPSIDIYFANFENTYYAGGNPLDGTITQIIQEKSTGSTTQFLFLGVAMKLSQSGIWRASEKVSQRIEWMASTRKRIQ